VRDVLLNNGFGVNIIFENLRKKLGLKKPKSTPFIIKMVDQRKVQPIGLINNLKFDLVGCEFKIFVTVLDMGNETETYSMFLGRPWLKHVKAYHNWGDNTFTIITRERTMAVNTILKNPLKLSKRLKYVDDGYDWEEGLLNEEEEQLYNAVPKLWHVGEVAPKELYFLKEIDYGMLQPKEKL
jgi:hypothetical protein